MTLVIYLVRHGQTLFNQRGLVQGWVDSPLTELGVEQARRTAVELSRRPLVGLYSSTSERAMDTAGIIGESHPGLRAVGLKGLRELYFGLFEATPNEDFSRSVDIPSFYAELLQGRGDGVPGGESGAQFTGRVRAALDEIVAAHPEGGEVAVVSHGITINALLSIVGWSAHGPIENASISVLRRDPTGAVDVLGVGLSTLPWDALRA